MMKKILFLCAILLAGIGGCRDEWDDHYGESGGQDGNIAGNLKEFLVSQEKYTRFVTLLEETDVLDTLASGQILTVWAVADENMPSVQNMEKYTIKEKRRLALNMVNYMPIYYPKFANAKKIQTLAGKNVYMAQESGGYSLDGVRVLVTNQVCKNGVVHDLAGLMTPRRNLYEYVVDLPDEYSMLRDSLLARNDTVFDIEHSFPVDVDPTGNTIYDSVFVIHNYFIGGIRDEETENTLMLCSNEAIVGAFEEMRTYLLADTLSTELKEDMNDWWIKALIYPEKIRDYAKDKSVYSIFNKHWRTDIQHVVPNGTVEVSNGLVYPVEKLIFPKASLLKDVEYIIPDLWQRVSTDDRAKYFSYGGKGYTTTSSEIVYVDAQLNNNPWAKGISNTWWRAHSTRKTEQDTVFAEFVMLEKDLKNKVAPVRLYPGSYDVFVWLRSYSAVPVTISAVSDALEGALPDDGGRYFLTLQDQAAQSDFSKTDVVGSYYLGKVGTVRLTKPTDDLRFNFVIWQAGSNKNINIRGIKLVANRDEMY